MLSIELFVEDNMLEKFEPTHKVKPASKKVSLEALKEMIALDNIDRDTAIFTRDPKSLVSSDKIINYFTNMVSSHEIGTCCVRESRKVGMISFTIKQSEDCVRHYRFAYISGQWEDVSELSQTKINKLLQTSPSFQSMNRTNIGNALDQLFSMLKNKYKLDYKNLIWPDSINASRNEVYKGYIISELLLEQSKQTYSNPIEILDKRNLLIKDCILDLSGISKDEKVGLHLKLKNLRDVPKKLSRDDLLNIFKDWLEFNDLDEGLQCPLSLCFFDNPYRLSSGQVIDKDSLKLMDPKTCPLTRAELTDEPVRLMGWNRALNHSLLLFIDLIQTYQRSLIEEVKDEAKGMPVVSLSSTDTFFNVAPQRKEDDEHQKSSVDFSRSK